LILLRAFPVQNFAVFCGCNQAAAKVGQFYEDVRGFLTPSMNPKQETKRKPDWQKGRNCFNCHTPLPNRENFCPNCGQKNTTSKLPVWDLLREAIASYLNLDSRFFRSLPIFIGQPGRLTVEFMSGRRKRFLHPVRFYFIVSIIFFFLFNKTVVEDNNSILEFGDFGESTKSLAASKAALSQEIDSVLTSAQQKGGLSKQDATIVQNVLNGLDQQFIAKQYFDTAQVAYEEMTIFGTHVRYPPEKLYFLWIRQPDMTPEALLDSMNAQNVNWLSYRLAEQSIKLGREDMGYFSREIIANIPVMMFLLIPLVALLLRLLYIRHNRYYLEHLVFTFHLFSFLFILFGLLLALVASLGESDVLILTFMGGGILYSFLSMLRVYKQGWIKTFLKLFVLGNLYLLLLTFALVLELFISLLLA